jgi:hypothetical protein
MRSGPFELCGPVEVSLLVKPGLQLDHTRDLLAALGRPDQRADERRVVAHAIGRHLDGDGVGVIGGGADEVFNAVVGMMDEQIAGADDVEHIRVTIKSKGRGRRPRRVAQVRRVRIRRTARRG